MKRPLGIKPTGANRLPRGYGPIGLAENPRGVEFHCPTCRYYSAGICKHPNKRLNGTPVGDDECCNLYDHEGMKVKIA